MNKYFVLNEHGERVPLEQALQEFTAYAGQIKPKEEPPTDQPAERFETAETIKEDITYLTAGGAADERMIDNFNALLKLALDVVTSEGEFHRTAVERLGLFLK